MHIYVTGHGSGLSEHKQIRNNFFYRYVIEGIHNRSLTSEAFGKNAARALRDVEDPKEKENFMLLMIFGIDRTALIKSK
jgi:hypothetical protein